MGSEDVAQVAEMRARHVRPIGLGYCRACFQQWPCGVSVLLAAYDAQAARLAAVEQLLRDLYAEDEPGSAASDAALAYLEAHDGE